MHSGFHEATFLLKSKAPHTYFKRSYNVRVKLIYNILMLEFSVSEFLRPKQEFIHPPLGQKFIDLAQAIAHASKPNNIRAIVEFLPLHIYSDYKQADCLQSNNH